MSFYRGYILTQEKKAITKFKDVPNDELLSYEQVELLPEYAGVMAEDSVLVDIDNMEDAKLLLKICEDNDIRCRIIESRSGMHFLFKNREVTNCPTGVLLACGIKADIKSGFKSCYEVLKIENKEREVLYDIYENEEYQIIPKWLYPIKGCNIDFANLGEGDGRNQALFNYILTLQSNDFEVEEIKETIAIVNKYVLKDPVSENELNVILRDDAFKKQSFYIDKKFAHDKFANYIKNTYHVKKINSQLHIYNNGVYVSGCVDIEKAMIKEISSLTNRQRKEVLQYLEIICEDSKLSDVHLIAFRNGNYNLNTSQLEPPTPSVIITNKIDWDYNTNAYYEPLDNTLNKIACNDNNIRMLLEEMIGSCLYRRNDLADGKAFILTGSGANGKSTLLNIIKAMLGKENTSALSLKKLDDKFSTVMMFGKLANIGDDISNENKADTEEFKKIVTGNSISAQQKGQPIFDFEPYCKLIFSANNMPRIGKGDDSTAILRRLVILPFNGVFTKNDADHDPQISTKLVTQESMEYLIQIGIQGLKRVLENKSYTSSSKVSEELNEYEKENNPILSFIDEVGVDEIENEPTADVYRRYTTFCSENGYNDTYTKSMFSRQLKIKYGVTTIIKKINNKSTRVYVLED